MQFFLKILYNIVIGLASEKLVCELAAVTLEVIKEHTETKIDDKFLDPIIKRLREI
jgi:hypothetical protein